jgi:hypothetical protein
MNKQARGTPVDALVKVNSVHAGADEDGKSNGKIRIQLEELGAVDSNRFEMRVHIDLPDQPSGSDVLRRIQPGSQVRVRGKVRELKFMSWGTNVADIQDGNLSIILDNPTVTPLTAPPGQMMTGLGKDGDGPNLLKSIATRMPESVRPTDKRMLDSSPMDGWLSITIKGARIDSVAKVKYYHDGAGDQHVRLEAVGPVTANGVDYFLDLSYMANDESFNRGLKKFPNGSWVRVRGTVGSHTASPAGKLVHISIGVQNPSFTAAAGPP